MSKWDELSMAEKAEMMKVAVRQGITNLSDIKQRYNEFAEGGSKEEEEEVNTIVPFTQRREVIITPDTEYNQYLNTLPDNQRFTPNDKYDSYFYWKLNGRPRNFEEAYNKGMFHYDHSDNGYHANSIAFDDNTGVGYFMKPKTHDTVGYELDWFNKGLVTEEGGKQRPVTPEEAKELEEFRKNYFLTNDPDRPNYYRYQPIEKAEGGGIHIKPSHRGRLTELKKRTGKSEAELYNDGNPAHKKMVVFARNARKWKHGLGGNLFDGTSQPSQKMQIGLNVQGWPNYTTEQIIANGERIQQQRKAIQDAYLNFVTESNDATAVANGRLQNKHLEERGIKGAKAHATWEKEHPVATQWGNVLGAVPFAVAAYPLAATAGSGIATLGDAAAATSAGQAITDGLAPLATATSANVAGAPLYTWTDAGLTSLFGGHGVQTAIDEGGVSPMTALEVAPMVVRTGVEAANTYNKLRQYSRLEKNYTGVPHKQADGTSVYMDESFPGVHRQHTVWATDDADYGRMFTVTRDAKGNVVRDKNGKTVYGKLFDVYTDPKELSVLETPKVPDGQMVYWQGLPYKLENGKVQYADNIAIKDNIIPKTKEIALKNKDNYGRYDFDDTGSYIWKNGEGSGVVVNWDQVPGAIKTDHVVQYSKDNGYHGTRFNKVYDGGVTLDKDAGFTFDYDLGDYYDYPINELVLNPGAPKYILTHNVPKYKVLNQLPNVFSQPKAPFGILPLINRKND